MGMTEYLTQLVQQLINEPNEQEWLEFKENYHSAEEIGERISALSNGACLANKRYGYLIFGGASKSMLKKTGWILIK